MPLNSNSLASCAIYPYDPNDERPKPFKEFQHTTKKTENDFTIEESVTIESVAGQKFVISVELEPRSYSMLMNDSNNNNNDHYDNHYDDRDDDYLMFIYLDGVQVQRSKRHRSQTGPSRISGVYSPDMRSTRSFEFAKLSLVDVDDETLDGQTLRELNSQLCDDEKVMQSLGTIKVEVFRCLLGKPKQMDPPRSNDIGRGRMKSDRGRGGDGSSSRKASTAPDSSTLRTSNQMKFSERSKKVMTSHTAGLGEAIPVASTGKNWKGKKTIRPIEAVDPKPFLQFVFKYKSRALLEAEGIIKPTVEQQPQPLRNDNQRHQSNSPFERNGRQRQSPLRKVVNGKSKDFEAKKEESDYDEHEFAHPATKGDRQGNSRKASSSIHRSETHQPLNESSRSENLNLQDRRGSSEIKNRNKSVENDQKPKRSYVQIDCSSSDEEIEPSSKVKRENEKNNTKPNGNLQRTLSNHSNRSSPIKERKGSSLKKEEEDEEREIEEDSFNSKKKISKSNRSRTSTNNKTDENFDESKILRKDHGFNDHDDGEEGDRQIKKKKKGNDGKIKVNNQKDENFQKEEEEEEVEERKRKRKSFSNLNGKDDENVKVDELKFKSKFKEEEEDKKKKKKKSDQIVIDLTGLNSDSD